AAGQHDHREADDDDGELAELAGRFDQRAGVEEAGDQAAEDGDRDRHREKGNGVVCPALRQELADQVIGDEIVAPALAGLWKGHVRGIRLISAIGFGGGSPRRVCLPSRGGGTSAPMLPSTARASLDAHGSSSPRGEEHAVWVSAENDPAYFAAAWRALTSQ